RVALGLPDKSGVPVVVSGCVRQVIRGANRRKLAGRTRPARHHTSRFKQYELENMRRMRRLGER
ncbi:MAG: hypothetical protein WCK27_11870, partial [Verrucomicrobiota bacterium]